MNCLPALIEIHRDACAVDGLDLTEAPVPAGGMADPVSRGEGRLHTLLPPADR